MRLASLMLVAGLLASAPALAASCIPDKPPADSPVVIALPDAYWRDLPAWSDMPAADRDLLARVSIVQRNIRALKSGAVFSSAVPQDVVPLATAPKESFIATGAPSLDALATAGRDHLRMLDPDSDFYVSDGFRSYAIQLEVWPRNLRKYFERIRDQLHPVGGRYSDEDVCTLRAYAGSRYAFPGFSHHQSGRAADFHARIGAEPELDSDSGDDAIARWCKSEIFAWLHHHARSYGFVQEKIDEPWHWVYDPAAAARHEDADYVAKSCQGVVR